MIREEQVGRSFNLKPLVIGTLAVSTVSLVALMCLEVSPLARHMLGHIATMNILAPMLAAGLGAAGWLGAASGGSAILWLASVAQMALLWAWHGLAVQHVVHSSPAMAFVLHAALLMAAVSFWCAVFVSGARPWQTILALLLSGKLACLLGALLVFSPRLLIHTDSGANVMADRAISDQHLGGLLMLAACPLSYILAAVVLVAQEINGLHRQRGRTPEDRPPIRV
jgi:putative membrane protein